MNSGVSDSRIADNQPDSNVVLRPPPEKRETVSPELRRDRETRVSRLSLTPLAELTSPSAPFGGYSKKSMQIMPTICLLIPASKNSRVEG